MGPGGIIGIVGGALLALIAAFGLTSSLTGTPAPVDRPFVQYGSA